MTKRAHATPSTHRPRMWLAVAVCGALLAIGLPLGWWVAHPAARPITQLDPGAAVALAQSAPAPSTPPALQPSATARPSTSTSPTAPLPNVPVVPGSQANPPAVPTPVRLQIPTLNIDAPIEAEGVNAQGDMALPVPVNQVGWYRFGPAPGSSTGAIVIAGHVDSAQQGDGALFRLRDATSGATITVTTSDGKTWRYRVLSREEFSKRTIPLAQIFTRSGAPHLTIITCGGTFNRAELSYDDNIVVTAVAE